MNGSAGPVPGEPGYIPPGWAEPQLLYPREAYTPARVTEYTLTPGQFAGSGDYSLAENHHKALGFPEGGGTASPDNAGVVSLGMAGGSITFEFSPPLKDDPGNIGGYDFIVFGNAYWTGTGGVWKEPGTVWVMKDEDGNGTADDTWYLIPGSRLDDTATPVTLSYAKSDYPDTWWPLGTESNEIWVSGVFLLDDSAYSTTQSCSGYADATPSLKRGDLSGADKTGDNNNLDDIEDYPEMDPVYFYTVPDNPYTDGIDPGSGGGDAIDIAWAVDPDTFTPAGLDEATWVRIVSGTALTGALGDFSCEIDAVTRVRHP
ncbi:MAG: hypothetical protein JXB03_05885 [Spirochaetales bacterium]|nr:hypothetical protein [Spirochaetales bacterium]